MTKAAEIVLNEDQARAEAEIDMANAKGNKHLLDGAAGTGKTTVAVEAVRKALSRKQSVAVTAPTHKALNVLRAKLRDAGFRDGVDLDLCTIQSLLSLKPDNDADLLVFKRDKYAQPVLQDVVVCDECSMVDSGLKGHIDRHLSRAFVLYLGDVAQIPPVGEPVSLTFKTRSRSRLNRVMRQGEGNPVLEAALYVRERQGTDDYDDEWAVEKVVGEGPERQGVFVPDHGKIPAWVARAFARERFDEDPDSTRYLAWTNRAVDDANAFIRDVRYGSDLLPQPFMPGERILFRQPLIVDGEPIFDNSEEATCVWMGPDTFEFKVKGGKQLDEYTMKIPSWRINAMRDDRLEVEIHMCADFDARRAALERLANEAIQAGEAGHQAAKGQRWKQYHALKGALADIGPPYALTVHKSQGSTIKAPFVDFDNISRCAVKDPFEMQRLMYTALTRASRAVILRKRA